MMAKVATQMASSGGVYNYNGTTSKYPSSIPQSGSYVASAGYPQSGSYVASAGSFVAPSMARGALRPSTNAATSIQRSVSPQMTPRYPQLARSSYASALRTAG